MEDEADPPIVGQIINDGTDGNEIEIANPSRVRAKMSGMERSRRAIALKLAGASYAQIAENLGYHDASGARKAVVRGMKSSLQESSTELRRIHYGRLEHMLMLVWPDVNKGDLQSMQAALNVMDRMERLYGLNAAEKIDVSHGPRETVIVADGEKTAYIDALKQAIEEEHDIVEAEIVEDEEQPAQP